MDNSTKIYDDQVDTIKIEDITTDIKNRIVLSWLRNNKYGGEDEDEDDHEYLWIQDEHDDDDAGSDYVPCGDYDMGWLGYFVGKSNSLLHLSIMNEYSLEPFLRGVNNNKSITSLSLYDINLLGGQAFTLLDSFFRNNPNLTEIAVNNCRFGIGCSHSLASAIGGCSRSLECLTVRYNDINEEEFVTIITSLSMHPQLIKLELEGNVIRKKGSIALATLLQHSTDGLQSLDLSANALDDIGIEVLVPALSKHRRLESLLISRNDSVTTRGWQSLATVLEDPNSNLKSLIMHADNIDDETASVFINALSSNCSLRELYQGRRTRSYSEDTLQSFSDLLCDTSSVNATYLSNHTLNKTDRKIQKYLEPLLVLNQNDDKKEVATIKILKHHEDFDMKPFFEWEFKVLPLVVGWLERASLYEYVRLGVGANIEGRKLSSIYQFIRDMPVMYVEARLMIELEDIKLEESQIEEEERERRLQFQQRQRQLQDRKKTIIQKLGVGKQAISGG